MTLTMTILKLSMTLIDLNDGDDLIDDDHINDDFNDDLNDDKLEPCRVFNSCRLRSLTKLCLSWFSF